MAQKWHFPACPGQEFFSLPRAFSPAGLRVESGRPASENAQACQIYPLCKPFWRGGGEK